METAAAPIQEGDLNRQEIWSWGAGTDGQLARGTFEDEHNPQLIRSLSAFGRITSVACGGAHAIALLPGGRVVAWGRGSSGQLGHGEMVNCLRPTPVKVLEGFEITSVSAGWNHSGFVSGDGKLLTCGDGSFGQLGHGDYRSQRLPLQVLHLDSKHVEKVACGMRHSLVMLSDSQVYAFGSGRRGQLGTSTEKVKSTNYPQILTELMTHRVSKISANGDHSAALSDDGSLFTWGRGFSGASDVCIPHQINVDASLQDIALGWNHALLLTREGEVFMLGGSRHGALSEPQQARATSDATGKSMEAILQEIPDLKGTKVLQIASGAEHSAVVTDNGSVMTWGWGEHGQLGLGDTIDQTHPQIVCLGTDNKHAIPRVYCGSGFSFVVTTYSEDN